jgi:hypothetical protein
MSFFNVSFLYLELFVPASYFLLSTYSLLLILYVVFNSEHEN